MTVHRLNQFDGVDWDAYPLRYEASFRWRIRNAPDLLFSCVDSLSARRMIHQYAVADHKVHRNGRGPARCQRIDGNERVRSWCLSRESSAWAPASIHCGTPLHEPS